MKLCGVVGYEYYDKNSILHNLAEFERIQELIYYQLRPVFGLEKHRIWGTRPLGQRWKGSVEARGTCQGLRCSGSEELPAELISITPKPPLDGWSWDSASIPIKDYSGGQNEFGGIYPIPQPTTLYSSDLNNLALNWGPSGQ